jgi:hypothetical protein
MMAVGCQSKIIVVRSLNQHVNVSELINSNFEFAWRSTVFIRSRALLIFGATNN